MSPITIIAKPCQSGKTFEMIKTIAEQNNKYTEVVFTDNLIDQSKQLEQRLQSHSIVCNRPIYAIHSKNVNKKERNIQFTLHEIKNGTNPVIVMPTNRSKLDNLRRIIEMIADTGSSTEVRVWFDEIDCHIRLIAPVTKMMLSGEGMYKCVKAVYGLTATGFNRVAKEFKSFNVHKWNPEDLENYYGFTDSGVQFITMDNGTAEKKLSTYIDYVMSHHHEELTKKGNFVFAPADLKNESHVDASKTMLECGMDRVIILNQHGLTEWALAPGCEPLMNKLMEKEAPEDCEDEEEECGRYVASEIDATGYSIEQVLEERYNSLNYSELSVCMIGNMKFRRGLTMQSRKGCIFTHAIGAMSKARLRDENARDNFTQLMSRVCGQFNDVRTEKDAHIKVYTTPDAMNSLLDNEHKSTDITKKGCKVEIEDEDTQVKFPNVVYATEVTFATPAQFNSNIPIAEVIAIR